MDHEPTVDLMDDREFAPEAAPLTARLWMKENLFSTTDAGRDACERYREVRDQCLIGSFDAVGGDMTEIGELADVLRFLSGLYDQAARTATSL